MGLSALARKSGPVAPEPEVPRADVCMYMCMDEWMGKWMNTEKMGIRRWIGDEREGCLA